MEPEIDKAFDWVVVILGILTGVLTNLPETMEGKKAVALAFVPSLLVLVVVWLFSHLATRTSHKTVLKTYAWFNASFLFLTYINEFFYVASPMYVYLFFRQGGPLTWVPLWVFLPSFIIMPFLLYTKAVQPKYRQVYTDSKFLAGRMPILLYILSLIIFIFQTLLFTGAAHPYLF